jgi:hypothetical protein
MARTRRAKAHAARVHRDILEYPDSVVSVVKGTRATYSQLSRSWKSFLAIII